MGYEIYSITIKSGWLVIFYGKTTLISHLMPNPVYIYIYIYIC